MVCWLDLFTRKPVDEPAELFLRNVGPAEVQSYRLSPDDAAQHQRRDGLTAVQTDVFPKSFVAAPDKRHSRHGHGSAARSSSQGLTARPIRYSPPVPRPAHPHADAQVFVSQVTEDFHPRLSPHHVRLAVVQRQSVRRGADGRGADHMALHLNAFWWRPAGEWAGTDRRDGCASVPAERGVRPRRAVHLPPPVSQPVSQVTAAIIKRPSWLLVICLALRFRLYWAVVLVGQTLFCFQRPSAVIGDTVLRVEGSTALSRG